MAVTRRKFLQAGLCGSLVLTLAGGLYRTLKSPTPPTLFILDDKARLALVAITGAMLQGTLAATGEMTKRAVQHTLEAIAGLPLATQEDIQNLFGLLTLAPTRRFLAGIPDDWSKAKREDVSAFLQDWRVHRFKLLQSAYHALHDLIIGGWYADETTWQAIGYPGPLKILS